MEEVKRRIERLPDEWRERAIELLKGAQQDAESLVLGDSAGV